MYVYHKRIFRVKVSSIETEMRFSKLSSSLINNSFDPLYCNRNDWVSFISKSAMWHTYEYSEASNCIHSFCLLSDRDRCASMNIDLVRLLIWKKVRKKKKFFLQESRYMQRYKLRSSFLLIFIFATVYSKKISC